MNDQWRPMATYRIQFNQDFRLTDAQALVPYFSRLGITHIYASPMLLSRRESTHGYDVVDPRTINPSVGDEAELVNLSAELHNFGLGLILDIVPNHMAANIENPYWRDVLTYGPSSPFANWFDIEWRMPDPEMWGRVLVPVLGDPRARVLDQDQIRLTWSEGRFLIQYFEHVFPVGPATVPMIYEFAWKAPNAPTQARDEDHSQLEKINEVLSRLQELPGLTAQLQRHTHIDRDETEQLLAEFARLVTQSPHIQQWIEGAAEQFSQGEQGRKRLRRLLDRQPYRLVYWRAASRMINYRRFFDINELVSVRQEDPEVFDETHATVLRWIEDGLIDGLRIDHIDGLRDPRGYLMRMSETLASGEPAKRQVPVYVEKILAADEKLSCEWAVAGTTGYEFLNQVEAVLACRSGFAEIEEQYRRMLRRPVHFEKIEAWGKRRVLRSDLSPQVDRLADALLRMATTSGQEDSAVMDTQEPDTAAEEAGVEKQALHETPNRPITLLPPQLTKRDCVDAIIEVITALPVYRTYVNSERLTVNDVDRQYVKTALRGAQAGGRAKLEAVKFLGEILLLDDKDSLTEHTLHERAKFIERFQQLTGPAAAKGIEDTALYAFVPLVSLNEVGGEPCLPPDSMAKLHEANEHRSSNWPQTMLAATTHDTKRSADVRSRLDVLSELPKLWIDLTNRWRRMNRVHAARLRGKRAPAASAEYLLYQTIVAIWPAPDPRCETELPAASVLENLCERIENYMLKAVRESKTHTSWTKKNQAYEDAVVSFVRGVLAPAGNDDTAFLSDVQNLVSRIARPGFWNSLSRTLLQFTSPGTPDLYQGDELWDFALVDPDNRRPVDFDTRRQLLDEVTTGIEAADASRRHFVRGLVDAPEDGRIKLHLVHRALAARRDRPHLFGTGGYLPLAANGPAKRHIVAFARAANKCLKPFTSPARTDEPDDCAIVAVPRLTTDLVGEAAAAPIGEAVWSDTVIRLPEPWRDREFTCVLTREKLRPASDGSLLARQVFRSFPAALLISERSPGAR